MVDEQPAVQKNTLQKFYDALLRSDRYGPAHLTAFQENVLSDFLPLVARETPFYRDRLKPVLSGNAVDFTRWQEIPVLTSAGLRDNLHDISRRNLPESHGHTLRYRSSGSTGGSLAYFRSALSQVGQSAAIARLVTSFKLDPRRPMATIRAFDPSLARFSVEPADRAGISWFPAALSEGETGKITSMSVFLPLAEQLRWLKGLGPVYLNTHPSHALALARHVAAHPDLKPEIAAVLTVGEPLTPDVRRQCLQHLGARCINQLSSAECGVVAVECPDCGALHVQSELCRVELLDQHGKPPKHGQWGRLVVTPFYNIATPLIRYDTGDLARIVERTSCGKSHIALYENVGRPLNLFSGGQGKWYRPDLDSAVIAGALGPGRWQLEQRNAKSFVLHHGADGRSADDAARAAAHVGEHLPAGARVTVTSHVFLGLRPSGKFSFFVNSADQKPGR